MLRCFVCVCVCVGIDGRGGACGFQWTDVSLISLCPLHEPLIASLIGTLCFTLCFDSPGLLFLDGFLPIPANSTHPSRSSFVKLVLHLQLGKIPPLALCPPPPSHPCPAPPSSLGLFRLSGWTVSFFMTRPCSVHFRVLCATLLHLK